MIEERNMESAPRILLADDEVRLGESQKLLLERDGYRVDVALSGAEALCLITEAAYDLFILDICMPGMDGFQLMEEILRIDPHAPIIMMTGYVSVDSAVKALKQGAYDYLKKPFDYSELAKSARNALAQRRLKEENRVISEKLKVSERRYRSMVQGSPDLIYTLCPEGKFTFVNKAFQRALGWSMEELKGEDYRMVIHEGDLGKAQWHFNERRVGARATAGIELRLVHRKKRENPEANIPPIHIELKATGCYEGASPGKRGRHLGTYGAARDITYRKDLEAQFRQAQKMEALGTLAGGIAHDFNNILMCIQGYSSLLRMGGDPDGADYKKLMNIEQHVQSGSELTRQLLGFASDNRNETRVKVIDLNTLLKKTASMFGRTNKEITIKTDLARDLWPIDVDEGQIKQVVLNLYVNAWQAMPEGGELRVESGNQTVIAGKNEELGLGPGNYARVSVVDNGIGMSEKIQQRIFEPFFTTKELGRGTGLGLASAYGIIKNHGGVFRVKSEEGKGSSFSFYLPSTDASPDAEILEPVGFISGKETVLLVDDEERIIEVTREMLENLGYVALIARSGGEALDLFRAHGKKIDLVLLDMVMPTMNGAETFTLLRRIDPSVRVLLTSGYNRQKEAAALMDTGADGFLQKPCSLEQLSEKLKVVLSRGNFETPLLSTGTKP